MDKKRLKKVYRNRFQKAEYKQRDEMWNILCNHFFNRFMKYSDDILDVAAGYCDFINNIFPPNQYNNKMGRRIAVDLNPDIKEHARKWVETYNVSADNLGFLDDKSIDVVFISNFLEHVRSKEEIIEILIECKRVLRKGGRICILQPNIRLTKEAYWDFFDHYTPLTEKSLVELIGIVGDLKVNKMITRFLPYTTKSSIPKKKWMIWLYLKVPIAWLVMGKQTFVVAQKIKE